MGRSFVAVASSTSNVVLYEAIPSGFRTHQVLSLPAICCGGCSILPRRDPCIANTTSNLTQSNEVAEPATPWTSTGRFAAAATTSGETQIVIFFPNADCFYSAKRTLYLDSDLCRAILVPCRQLLAGAGNGMALWNVRSSTTLWSSKRKHSNSSSISSADFSADSRLLATSMQSLVRLVSCSG